MRASDRVLKLQRRVSGRLLPGLPHLPASRLTRCPCCERPTLVLALSEGDELRVCVRCRGGLRYWMLADWLRREGELERSDVLELDGHSPLRFLLARSKTWTRTFWDPDVASGTVREDGAQREDIIATTFADATFDLIVSSEVLEHVPDFEAAMRESMRILRPGGRHLFTVPPRRVTQRRAKLLADGSIEHLTEPEYHSDPLSPDGILAFWDIGTRDAAEVFDVPEMELGVVAGPAGRDGRVIWSATRRAAGDAS